LELIGKVRESVNLRAYEQKSPLNIYIEEVDKMFQTLKHIIAHRSMIEILSFLKQRGLGNNQDYVNVEINSIDTSDNSSDQINLENAKYDIYLFNESEKQML